MKHNTMLSPNKQHNVMKSFIAFKLSGVVFIMLLNVKMQTIVRILTFMSRINFMSS